MNPQLVPPGGDQNEERVQKEQGRGQLQPEQTFLNELGVFDRQVQHVWRLLHDSGVDFAAAVGPVGAHCSERGTELGRTWVVLGGFVYIDTDGRKGGLLLFLWYRVVQKNCLEF